MANRAETGKTAAWGFAAEGYITGTSCCKYGTGGNLSEQAASFEQSEKHRPAGPPPHFRQCLCRWFNEAQARYRHRIVEAGIPEGQAPGISLDGGNAGGQCPRHIQHGTIRLHIHDRELPFLGLVGSPLHWLFDRSRIEGREDGDTLLNVTISGARGFVDDSPEILVALFEAEAARVGFAIERTVVEAEGLCGHCRAAAA